jgi:hypothetical protein
MRLAALMATLLISCHRTPTVWRGAPTDTICPVSVDSGSRCIGGGKILWCIREWEDHVFTVTCAPLVEGVR